MKDVPTLVALTASLALAVASTTPPLAAAPAPEAVPSIAGERLLGTVLRIEPRLDYESAAVRIAGPGAYALSKRFATGEPIDVDLLADAEPRGERLPPLPGTSEPSLLREGPAPQDPVQRDVARWRALPDGKYRYEIDFVQHDAAVRVHRGRFYARAGAAASNPATPVPSEGSSDVSDSSPHGTSTSTGPTSGLVSETGESLVESDYIRISDTANDGLTWFGLDARNSAGTLLERWALANIFGDLTMVECGNGSPQAGNCNQFQITMLEDTDTVRIGLGTGSPLQELHVDSDDGGDILLTGGGPQNVSTLSFETANGGRLLFDDTDTNEIDWTIVGQSHLFVLFTDASQQASLVVTPTGVGIGGGPLGARFRVWGDARIEGDVAMGSSRTLKTGFDAVDPTEMLAKLADLPVTSWRYKTEDEASRHIGPVAEDFQRLFGLGDGETISVVDAQGVALPAIQGVDTELQRLRTRNQELTQRLSALEETLAALVSEREQAKDGEGIEGKIQ